MVTTIILTVSRPDHLPAVFMALELLTCDRERTGLLVYVDGDADLHELAAQFCEASKFKERRTVKRPEVTPVPKYDLYARRQRIADIHNELRGLVGECKYVFCVEDDTVVPPNGLEKLQRLYGLHPYAGFVSGVQLGRHGLPHVGAWEADNVYEPTMLTSLMPPTTPGVQEVDAAGWFCYLTTRAIFIGSEYKPFETALGPDVQFGLDMRREGRRNYVDWSVQCEHRYQDEVITLVNTEPMRTRVFRSAGEWRISLG